MEDWKAELEVVDEEEIEELRSEVRNLQKRLHAVEKKVEKIK